VLVEDWLLVWAVDLLVESVDRLLDEVVDRLLDEVVDRPLDEVALPIEAVEFLVGGAGLTGASLDGSSVRS
jgi:hypothetical protein